ncbi:MAG TPA: aspartate/glutamate racemase family protein [Thermoanaerobaculia bacterium]|nr:aspartate/glutamate racemase family protein [Thermoanaerobaculia bacterium]
MLKRLGILGGMGPLASAEFLQTFYRLNTAEPEQDSPVCVLLSDPTFPDRTEAILRGERPAAATGSHGEAAPNPAAQALGERLSRALDELSQMGAERIVIACVTIHHFLPAVPAALCRKVVSLIDLIVDAVLAAPRPYLLLATNGTRAARILERHQRWSSIARWIEYPGEGDQRELHEHIYRLKGHAPPGELAAWLDALAVRSGMTGGSGFIFGCTELHLLHRGLAERSGGPDGPGGPVVIDPLLIAARDFRQLLNC